MELKKIAISAGYGLIDLGLELNPVSVMGYDAKDIVRVATTLGSFALNYMGKFTDITEVLFYSSLPLTIKTVYGFVKGAIGGTKKVAGHTLTVMPVSPAQRKKLEFIGIR